MGEVVALLGSARRNGNTGQLLDDVARELSCDVVDLASLKISAYDYSHQNQQDDFLPTVRRLLQYEKIIFASPVYWYSFSAQMKLFIDRTSDLLDLPELLAIGRQLRGKKGFVVCTSVSNEADVAFLQAFEKTFRYLGIGYGGHIHVNCEDGYDSVASSAARASFVQQVLVG